MFNMQPLQISNIVLYCHNMYNLGLSELCAAKVDYVLCYAWPVFLSQFKSTRKFAK